MSGPERGLYAAAGPDAPARCCRWPVNEPERVRAPGRRGQQPPPGASPLASERDESGAVGGQPDRLATLDVRPPSARSLSQSVSCLPSQHHCLVRFAAVSKLVIPCHFACCLTEEVAGSAAVRMAPRGPSPGPRRSPCGARPSRSATRCACAAPRRHCIICRPRRRFRRPRAPRQRSARLPGRTPSTTFQAASPAGTGPQTPAGCPTRSEEASSRRTDPR